MYNDYVIVNNQGQILLRNLEWDDIGYEIIDNRTGQTLDKTVNIKNAYIGDLNQCKLLIMNIGISIDSVTIIRIPGPESIYNKWQLYNKLIDNHGIDKQLIVAVEEMAELQKEICKILRTGNINMDDLITEIADTEIMIDQVKYYYGIYDRVNKEIDYKLNRTNNRLERGLI